MTSKAMDSNAALRAAIKRLMAAVNKDVVEITVQRRDVELLLCVKGPTLRPMPNQ